MQELSVSMTTIRIADSDLPFKFLKYIKMNLIVIKI